MMKNKIGIISDKIIILLGLSCPCNTPIFLGPSNIDHMVNTHPEDHEKYFQHISLILSAPDYVGLNSSDDSIEFVKEFAITNTEYVKVAVRVSSSGQYFARSIYVLNSNRVNNFIKKGTLRKL